VAPGVRKTEHVKRLKDLELENADSDEVARAFRDDVARCSDISLDGLVVRERRRLWPVRLIRCALWTMRSRMASA
jgi:hypothetical protein